MLSKLETPEAEYLYEGANVGHFAIDCSCKGKDGSYHGCHYKNISQGFKRQFDEYDSIKMNKSKHTFLMGSSLFKYELEDHNEENPLIIVCNDCGKEFSFTLESYLRLKIKMKRVD
jgi:hypothetical protein